ncbi:MAG: hypothetical protein V1800_15620 [Candidatus Latescibacterota bacterium]
MRISRNLSWLLLAGSIVAIGYNVWFFGAGYRIGSVKLRQSFISITTLQRVLIIVSWGWFALSTFLLIGKDRICSIVLSVSPVLLHILAVIALAGIFNPYGMADTLDIRGYFRVEGRNSVFGFSATYLVSFSYWRFSHYMRSKSTGQTTEDVENEDRRQALVGIVILVAALAWIVLLLGR